MIGPRPMTTIIRSNATAARPTAEKFSPAKIGSARNCKSVMLDISHRISRVRLRPGETLASQRDDLRFRRASTYDNYSAPRIGLTQGTTWRHYQVGNTVSTMSKSYYP